MKSVVVAGQLLVCLLLVVLGKGAPFEVAIDIPNGANYTRELVWELEKAYEGRYRESLTQVMFSRVSGRFGEPTDGSGVPLPPLFLQQVGVSPSTCNCSILGGTNLPNFGAKSWKDVMSALNQKLEGKERKLFIFIRHGYATENARPLNTPPASCYYLDSQHNKVRLVDSPLTLVGVKQATALGTFLNQTVTVDEDEWCEGKKWRECIGLAGSPVYVSPMERTLMTAKGVFEDKEKGKKNNKIIAEEVIRCSLSTEAWNYKAPLSDPKSLPSYLLPPPSSPFNSGCWQELLDASFPGKFQLYGDFVSFNLGFGASFPTFSVEGDVDTLWRNDVVEDSLQGTLRILTFVDMAFEYLKDTPVVGVVTHSELIVDIMSYIWGVAPIVSNTEVVPILIEATTQ